MKKIKDTLPPQFVYDKVRELREGMSDEEIARKLGITLNTVTGITGRMSEVK